MAATIEALFPGQPVHLFGNSMGGAVALQVAARRADLVRTLCLISPALPDLRPHLSNMHIPVMAMPRVGNVLFNRYQKVEAHQRVKATFDLCYADPSRLHPQRRAEAEEEARRRDALPWIRDAFVGSTQGLLATYMDRGPERPWALARLGGGADAAGVRAQGQAGGPEGGAPGDQGVLGRARDGHPGLGSRGDDGAPGAGGPLVAGVAGRVGVEWAHVHSAAPTSTVSKSLVWSLSLLGDPGAVQIPTPPPQPTPRLKAGA